MRIALLTIVAVALAMVGASILGSYWVAPRVHDRRDRVMAEIRDSHLRVIQERLAILKSYLAEYKNTHNRYPTNDEGLGAIDFDSRFEVILTLARGQGGDFLATPYTVEAWAGHGENRHGFRRHKGRPPTSQGDLLSAGWTSMEPPDYPGPVVKFEAAIGGDDHLFLLNHGQVLTPWLTPFGYENRNGHPTRAFDDSPVNRDAKGQYSARVDDGVYVYCFGGAYLTQEPTNRWWRRNWGLLLGGAFLSASIALLTIVVVLMPRRIIVVGMVGAILVLSAMLGYSAGPPNPYRGTYCPVYDLFSRRYPQMVAQQRELLDKYRAAGVISDATHSKAVAALGPFTPATAPADAD